MITGIPELNRYLDDKQWKAVSQAIRASGGKVTDGNRLHVDAVLDLMQSRRAWRDLDYRYGQWSSVHAKFVRWFETGILHSIVMALFKVGLTDTWRETYTEFSSGPSAVSGPQIRPLMAQIANGLRRHREEPKKRGRAAAPKLPAPEGNTYRERTKAYAKKVKEAVKARKGLVDGRIANEDWELIASRIPDLGEAMNATRRQVEELIDVMRTNKGWAYMDKKAGKWNVAYAKFAKWASDGTMARLVKCLAQLGLTKDWNRFLVAPLGDGEKSLKMIIGAEAWLHEGEGRTRRRPKAAKPKTEAKTTTTKPRDKKTAKTAKSTTVKAKAAKSKTTKVNAKTKKAAAAKTATAARKTKDKAGTIRRKAKSSRAKAVAATKNVAKSAARRAAA
ncbi:transposase [Rhizobium sp. BK176]|uniref:transposase n=1 Tax=Rhizobium sp. BK176 TaxID=2587071 RepID=UPI002168BA76|nr:transposase [Rhizobium sp. BK176]MCS4089372.1 transposase [Rhizobium sp. BK176]